MNFLFKGIGSHWTVELDGETMEDDFSLVSVCNGRYYGECIPAADVPIRLADKRLNFFGPAGCDCNRTARDI